MKHLEKFRVIGLFLSLLLITTIFFSCIQSKDLSTISPALKDGKYDSSPYGNSLEASINSIGESITKMGVLAFYKTWAFPRNSEYSNNFILESDLEIISSTSSVSNQSVTGTALLVYNHDLLAGFLTCAHLVDFPDTIFTYYDDEQTMVKTYSKKIRQQIYISGLSGGSEVEVVVSDEERDLVLLKKIMKFGENELKPLDLNVGSTSKLEWGSEILVLGYPLGNLMLTKGIVSIDNNIKKRILSDAMYNRGISGSPVFAMLDGSNNLEWIGMASSASSQTVRYLKPIEDNDESIISDKAYFGDAFIDEKRLINYGVTYSISIDEILKFMSKNKSKIKESGFDTDLFSTSKKIVIPNE